MVRDKLKEALKIIVNGSEQEMIDFVAKFRAEFMQMPFHEVAFPRGISGLTEYTSSEGEPKKGTPIQVRGAIVYNRLLRDHGIRNFEPVYEGDKAKFAYLTWPNPAHSHVITVPGMLPRELGLDEYVDRETQFQKAFVDSIEDLLTAVGWHYEETNTVMGLFTSAGE